MDIQPIKNEENYDNALAEIEALWGAEEGTEKGDKLDILLVLVEACEEKFHQISPNFTKFHHLIQLKQSNLEWSK